MVSRVMTVLIEIAVWSENQIKLKHAELSNIKSDIHIVNIG
jgi:hypothetical protein